MENRLKIQLERIRNINAHIPKVSVVIPTRNRVDMLSRAIKSVLGQTMNDFEIIVVDDASTDDLAKVLEALEDARIFLVRHQECRGGGASRNTGIQHARGEFVAFLDDDDEWLPEKLEIQVAAITRDDRIGMTYTGSFHVDQRSGRILQIAQPDKRINLSKRLLADNVVGTTSAVMVRKSFFSDVVMFDETLNSCQDWDFYLKVMKHGLIDCIKRPLVKHYHHDDRITGQYSNVIKGHRAILEKVVDQVGDSNEVVGYHHFKIGKLALQFGDSKTGRHELIKSLSYSPWRGTNYLYLMASLINSDAYRKIASIWQMVKARIAIVQGPFGHG